MNEWTVTSTAIVANPPLLRHSVKNALLALPVYWSRVAAYVACMHAGEASYCRVIHVLSSDASSALQQWPTFYLAGQAPRGRQMSAAISCLHCCV